MGNERETERHGRWASGSGLTRRSSQGWAHDQILSLIWRRFTQKSPFPSFFLQLSSTSPSHSRRLIIPASSSSISPHPSTTHPTPLTPRTLPRCSRDRSVKPHTLGIEYIKVPSILSLQLYYASFRPSVFFFLSLFTFPARSYLRSPDVNSRH